MMHPIRRKILLFTAIPIGVIYAAMIIWTLLDMRQRASGDVERRMTELAQYYAGQFDAHFREAAQIASSTATFFETVPDITETQIYAQLQANVIADPIVYGACAAFETGVFPGREVFGPYVYRGAKGLERMDVATDAYDYRQPQWQWWHLPRDSGHGHWTEPFFDEGAGDILMCTWTAPFRRNGKFAGVTTIDIPLTVLNEKVGIRAIENLDFIVVTPTGQYVYHPDKTRIMTDSLYETGQRQGRDDYLELARRMTSGKAGVYRLPGWRTHEQHWVFHAPIASTGWSFAAWISEEEALAEVQAGVTRLAVVLGLSLFLIVACVWFVSGLLARPLSEVDANFEPHLAGVHNRLKILGYSIVTITIIGLVVSALTIYILYREAFDQQARSLAETVDAQAQLINAVARFNLANSQAIPSKDAAAATIRQVVDAHQHDHGIGETGEFMLGRIGKTQIDFLLGPRHAADRSAAKIPIDGEGLGEPMRRALRGESGTMIGLDYRGQTVLAAYTPVDELRLGIVAKMDLGEIRSPFVRAGSIAAATGLLLVTVGGLLIVSINSPLIRQLERSESKFRSLVDNIPGITYRNSRGGDEKIHFIAGNTEELTGYPSEYFLKNGIEALVQIIHPDDVKREAAVLHRTLKTRQVETVEYRVIHRDGSVRWVRDKMRPVYDEQGRFLFHDGVIFDITDRKKTEELVAKQAAEADVLRQAAESANNAKSEFLSNMSHELRTPLNGVLGYVQILQSDPSLKTEQRQSLDTIESCGQHLLTLINEVLDLSKIEAGRLDVHLAPYDLARLIAGVADIVRPRARTKGLELNYEVSPDAPTVIQTDVAKLRQVLVNLLGNAVKFTEKGSVALRVSAPEAGQLTIEVQDTGIGIRSSQLEKIFDAFKQAESGMAAGGTGLGLAISRKLVEALDGRLTVVSEPGQGSCFTITLPIGETDDLQAADFPEETWFDRQIPKLASGQEMTVLIADEHEPNRNFLVHLLAAAGFKTVEAKNGVEALACMRRQPCDVALLDIRMPVMDGVEAAKQIRNDPRLKDAVVIAVSANVISDLRKRYSDVGFDDFLSKPLRAADLYDSIKRHTNVQLIYADQPAPALPQEQPGRLTLPPGQAKHFADRLRQAAEMGDVTELSSLVAELSQAGAAVQWCDRVQKWVDAFDFQEVIALANEMERTG